MIKEILVVALLSGGHYVGDDNNVRGITQSLKDKGFNNVQYEVVIQKSPEGKYSLDNEKIYAIQNTLDQQNFVMDTDLFKIPFQKRIIDQMDHSFVIDKHDPLFDDFNAIALKDNLRLYIVDFSPSFEALAEYFFNCMQDIIKEVELDEEVTVIEAKVTGEHMTVEAVFNRYAPSSSLE